MGYEFCTDISWHSHYLITFQNDITVSNKKTNLPDFETCVFRVYLRNHLSYKKLFTFIYILV